VGIIRAAARGDTVATRRQVESKLRELIGRLDAAGSEVSDSLAESLPDARIVEVVVPDLAASYWTEMTGGRMGPLRPGPPPHEAEIRIHVGSDHLVELVNGEKSLFSSYLGGQVRIEASLTDLMRLRKLA
jgi:hypothetical protein